MHSESSFPQRSPETPPTINTPPSLTFTELMSDEPAAVEKFAQNEAAILLIDTRRGQDTSVQDADVEAAIGIITDNALRAMGRTPDNRQLNVVVRQPHRAITLVGGLKQYDPEAYAEIYDSAAFHTTQIDSSQEYARQLLGGFVDIIITVEAGVDPEARAAAYAALEQRNRDIDALFQTDL